MQQPQIATSIHADSDLGHSQGFGCVCGGLQDGFIEVEKLGYISSDTTADYLMIKAVAMIMSNNSLF